MTVLRSTNNGETWTRIRVGSLGPGISYSIVKASNSNIYIGVFSGGSYYIYVSSDNGLTYSLFYTNETPYLINDITDIDGYLYITASSSDYVKQKIKRITYSGTVTGMDSFTYNNKIESVYGIVKVADYRDWEKIGRAHV